MAYTVTFASVTEFVDRQVPSMTGTSFDLQPNGSPRLGSFKASDNFPRVEFDPQPLSDIELEESLDLDSIWLDHRTCANQTRDDENARDASSDDVRYCHSQECRSDRLILFEGHDAQSDCLKTHGDETMLSTDQGPLEVGNFETEDEPAELKSISMSRRLADGKEFSISWQPSLKSHCMASLSAWLDSFMLRTRQPHGIPASEVFKHLHCEGWGDLFELFPDTLLPVVQLDLEKRANEVVQQMLKQRSRRQRAGFKNSRSFCIELVHYEDNLDRSKNHVELEQQRRSMSSTRTVYSTHEMLKT